MSAELILLPMTLYSIGHSNVSADKFLSLLRQHQIETLADVRSQPYSRYAPHFSRDTLRATLTAAGVAYLFLGDQIGGRPADQTYYLSNGRVDYEALANSATYLSGIEQLLSIAEASRVAFMCAEADYRHCHRYHLITRTLTRRGIAISHILSSGALTTSVAAEFDTTQPRLFAV